MGAYDKFSDRNSFRKEEWRPSVGGHTMVDAYCHVHATCILHNVCQIICQNAVVTEYHDYFQMGGVTVKLSGILKCSFKRYLKYLGGEFVICFIM